MAGFVAKTAANMLLKKQMKEYRKKKPGNKYDPLFATVEDPNRPNKLIKVKKVIPDYIPEHDALILASVRNSAYRLEWSLFDLFGTRFGWESVIGIIPGFGDAIGALLALTIYKKCQKIDGGLPTSLSIKMLFFILADFIIGLIPFVGDLGDAALKCNSWNVHMLGEHLDQKYRPSSRARDDRDLSGVNRETRRKHRQSGVYSPQDPPAATVFEDYSDEEADRRDFIRQTDPQRDRTAPARNVPSAAIPETRTTAAPVDKKRSSWFSGGRSKPAAGTEMAQPART